MKNILLICNAGMSTSVLVRKMEEQAKERGLEVNIEAIGDGSDENKISEADVILLAPQIRYLKSRLEGTVEVQIGIIDMQDYGMMRGDKILDYALSLIDQE